MIDLDMLGADETLVGEYDIADKRRQMDSIKKITVSIARAMLRGGQQVAAATVETAKGGFLQRELPGITSLKKTASHLDWHAAELAKLGDPTAFYAPGEDLKKWTMQAFIDANAVEEGRASQEQIWQDMWTDIGAALIALPGDVAQGVGKAVGQVVKAAASGLAGGLTEGIAEGVGIPRWILFAGGAALVVGVGLGLFKILLVAAPAVVPAVVGRYLR